MMPAEIDPNRKSVQKGPNLANDVFFGLGILDRDSPNC